MILVVIKFNIQDMASSFCILMEFKMTFEVKLVARALFRSHFPNQGRREKKSCRATLIVQAFSNIQRKEL